MRQITLTGEETEEGFQRPDTMMWCETCQDYVLRSEDHPHQTMTQAEKEENDDDSLPEEAQFDTQTFHVEFTMEVVETLVVEARNASDAKEIAQQERDHRGEYIQTYHTEADALDEPTQASEDYLKKFRLIPLEDDE